MTGFINVNKAEGVSSAREVAIIKRLTQAPCGHMGTLDPMASGVLPVAIGKASRLFDYFLNKIKIYTAVFRFGMDSDTLDTTGEVKSVGHIPKACEIESILGEFKGEILQLPPKYSAKNVGGRRAYELARKGEEFQLESKKVHIYDIRLTGQNGGEFSFEIECGGGTYIRSLARDIAKRLGTFAVMSALRRDKSGFFGIETAVSTEILTPENIKNFIIPTENVLPYENFYPDAAQSKKIFNGLEAECDKCDGIYKLFNGKEFYGLAEVRQSKIRMRTKLC